MIPSLTEEQKRKIKEELKCYMGENISDNFNCCLDIHEFLSHVTLADILNKIEHFQKIDLKTISDNDLMNAISDVLSVKINGLNQAMLMHRFSEYPSGTRFYRVRKINDEDFRIPCDTIKKEQDVWNPPVECVTRPGRLNKVNESLLYTSPITPLTPIMEMNISESDKFGLIVYESIQPIKVVLIGLWNEHPDLSKEENLKMRMYYHFLYTEFTKDVGYGTEHLYRVSEMITKDYFDLPPRDMQDAWCYPSIASKQNLNVCFRPEIAKDVLKFVGVQFAQIKKTDQGEFIKCYYIGSGFDSSRNLLYYPISSAKCREIFPEIQLSQK